MSFEEWYDQHFGSQEDKDAALASATTAEIDPSRLDYSPEGDQVEKAVGSVFQSVRDAPGWAAKKIYRGATRTDLPPPPSDPYGWSLGRASGNFWNMTGEGPSAREQEIASGVPPPVPSDWSFSRAVQHFSDQIPDLYNQLKQSVLPPGFDVQRGLNSAIAPAKWLFNEVRQGVLPDEAIDEIKRDPYSVKSLGAYLNAAISLSRGEGGEEIPLPSKPGAVPENIWNTFKIAPPYDDPKIRVDNAGNHFEYQGSHTVVDPETGQETRHIIAKQVEPPPKFNDKWYDDALAQQSAAIQPPPNEQNMPDWLREEMIRQGKNPNRPFNEIDITNPSIREAIKNDPTLTQEQKDSLLKTGDYPAVPGTDLSGKSYNPTTWEQLNPAQKQWFQDQWKSGRSPGMKDLPPDLGKTLTPEEFAKLEALSIHDPSSPHFDQSFTDWWKKVYPEDFEGDKFIGGPSKEPLNLLGEGSSGLSKSLESEPGNMWDEWAKKHGGQKPDFGPPAPPPELPPQPEPWGTNLPVPKGSWGNINDRKYSGPLVGQEWADMYATPDVDFTVGGKWEPEALDKMLSDWAKMMDDKGIDVTKPPQEDDPEGWWKHLPEDDPGRWNWKPPQE
jgi:hypothetical protein